jgi:aldehyde dehydrogenase (NAD+)/betaine-aldehyde dehydrogenase
MATAEIPQTQLGAATRELLGDQACYIDGGWERGSEHEIAKLDPATGEVLGRYACAGPEQVNRALKAARRAHDAGVWSSTTPAERSATLHRLATLMERHREKLLDVVVADVGTPISFAGPMQLDAAVLNVRWFADAAKAGPDGWYERGMTLDLPEVGPASTGMLVHEPIGVVAAITAYNFPFTLMAWKLGGALAAGCTVVLQPSPRSTLSSLALFRLVEQLELPAGVVNFVIGEEAVGRQLSTAPEVDLVSFTGSVPVGASVMGQAAPGIKRVVLELGGKSPNVLLPGCDMEAVIAPSVQRLVTNAGQRCGATSRIIVHEDDVDRFTAAAAEYLASVQVGDPRDRDTLVGPLVDTRHRDFVAGHVDRALADGARVLAGGGELPAALASGAFLMPVLLGGLENEHAYCQEEQFGPVGAVLTYRDVDRAVELANASQFGLNASVFGPTVEALRVARRIKAGTVGVNGGGRIRPDAPWGGFGHSGVGREAGNEGFREFFEVKHIQWPVR